MPWIIFESALTLALLIVVLVAAVGGFTRWDLRTGDRQTYGNKPIFATLAIWILATVAATGFMSYKQVDFGHVGVVKQFGEIIGTVDAGPHFMAPWKTVESVNIQTNATGFGTNADAFPRIEASSSETQDVFYTVTVNWNVDPTNADNLLIEHGADFFRRIDVQARVEQHFKQTVVGYTSIEATTQRAAIREQVTATLRQELADFYIVIRSIQINNIGYTAAFNDAIERKQVATQDAFAAEERVAITEAEARSKVAEAQGVADAAVIAAEANASVITIEADAQAAANRTIAASLTDPLIRFEALSRLPDTTVFLPSDGTINLLDIAAAIASEPAE
ncbi:MAG: prohibitin family protein [Dehalococcoidia bacterium]|jgi:prohibitin 2|nr:prohibitin family protein [Dehalococcoidia bacterium]